MDRPDFRPFPLGSLTLSDRMTKALVVGWLMGGGRALAENPAEGGNRAERTLPFRTVPTSRIKILFTNEDTFDGSRELITLHEVRD